MNIDKIVIACFRKDVALVRSCVASIRYWYPNVEIYLLKDIKRGGFSTQEIERNFNVIVLNSPGKYFGWGTAKLEAFFLNLDRFLLLDSDTVFLGKVLDELSCFDEDFIVTGVDYEPGRIVARDYINVDEIKKIDSNYVYPGYGINSGHIVMTTGKITMHDIDEHLVFHNGSCAVKYDHVFPYADQGLINYLFEKMQRQGKITVRYHDFWLWPDLDVAKNIPLKKIKDKIGIPMILHWAGIKSIDCRKYTRYDFMKFYNDYYYDRIRFGSAIKLYRRAVNIFIVNLKIVKHKLLGEKFR